MKKASARRKSMEKKLAVAMSLVNVLNAGAPVALPYVNITQSLSTKGGHTEPLTAALAHSLYGTAQAATTQTIPEGETKSAA